MKTLWRLRYVLLTVLALSAAAAAIVYFPWLLLAPLILWLLAPLIYRIRRARSLRKRGYFLGFSKIAPHVYQEVFAGDVREMVIPAEMTEPGRYELFVPAMELWEKTAPDWARSRREEIFTRIAPDFRKMGVHYPGDWTLTTD